MTEATPGVVLRSAMPVFGGGPDPREFSIFVDPDCVGNGGNPNTATALFPGGADSGRWGVAGGDSAAGDESSLSDAPSSLARRVMGGRDSMAAAVYRSP